MSVRELRFLRLDFGLLAVGFRMNYRSRNDGIKGNVLRRGCIDSVNLAMDDAGVDRVGRNDGNNWIRRKNLGWNVIIIDR